MTEEKFDIRRLAKLARLHIDDGDAEKFKKNMHDIVAMVEHLPEFSDTRLTLDPADAMELRLDMPAPSLPREEVLKNAPKVEAGCVVVPKIVE